MFFIVYSIWLALSACFDAFSKSQLQKDTAALGFESGKGLESGVSKIHLKGFSTQ